MAADALGIVADTSTILQFVAPSYALAIDLALWRGDAVRALALVDEAESRLQAARGSHLPTRHFYAAGGTRAGRAMRVSSEAVAREPERARLLARAESFPRRRAQFNEVPNLTSQMPETRAWAAQTAAEVGRARPLAVVGGGVARRRRGLQGSAPPRGASPTRVSVRPRRGSPAVAAVRLGPKALHAAREVASSPRRRLRAVCCRWRSPSVRGWMPGPFEWSAAFGRSARTDTTRGGGAGAHDSRPDQPADRHRAVHLREDRRRARLEYPRQARRLEPSPGSGPRRPRWKQPSPRP